MQKLSLVLLLVVGLVVPANAKLTLSVRGGGYGHGVGMSQFGAFGFAKNGYDHQRILRHYYSGTRIGSTDADQIVRVLLQNNPNYGAFKGAVSASGRKLNPRSTYIVRRKDSATVTLYSAKKRRIGSFGSPLRVNGPGTVVLKDRAQNGVIDGAYRDTLEFVAGAFKGVSAVNAVELDHYVAGVVARESPPSWPIEALKAQAIVARTYAITTSKRGRGFSHYADTRSQVYGGAQGEFPSTNQAVRETQGDVVEANGRPVTTYFFSTSGGKTENVENVWGGQPKSYLRSVDDPYDNASPYHRWTKRFSQMSVQRRLGGLVKGRFRAIKVNRRGISPRVISAEIVGSGGRTPVDGKTLRARLGLRDTWAYFTSISASKRKSARKATFAKSANPFVPQQKTVEATGTDIGGSIVADAAVSAATLERRWAGKWMAVEQIN